MMKIKAIWAIIGGWRTLAAFALGAVLAFSLGQCSGAAAAKKREEASRAVAIQTTLTVDGAAKETASAQRLEDAAAVADQTEALTNAVASLPDAIPSPRRVAIGCARLRQAAGADLSNLPLVCRPEAGPQAGPAG